MEDQGAASAARRDVAPLISDAKASQAWRRFLSTVLGGGRIVPGMTLKIYLFQALLWFCPIFFSGSLALGLPQSAWPHLRLVLGALVNFCYGVALELLHWAVLRRDVGAARKRVAAWFVDEDEVDFQRLFSKQVMDLLLPRRSLGSAMVSCLLSSALGALTAQLLVPTQLAKVLQMDLTSAYVVSCWAFLTAGLAHFGLHVEPAPEVTNCSTSSSRCFLVLALLAPLLWQLPVHWARLLLMTVALLPLLWSGGVVPSLMELLLWALEQVESHFFGGAAGALPAIAWSLTAALGIAWAGRSLEADGTFEYILLAGICLAASSLLTLLTSPLDVAAFRAPRARAARLGRLAQSWLQALLAFGLLLPCILASLPTDLLLPLRIVLEQVALLLTLLAVYVLGHWQLRASCCGMRNAGYLRHRQKLLWDNQGGPQDHQMPGVPVSEQLVAVAELTGDVAGAPWLPPPRACAARRRVARQVEVVQLVARILLLLHMSFFSTPDLLRHRGSELWYIFLLVALQLRQLRLALASPSRAALDAALAGLLHWAFFFPGAREMPAVAVEIFVVSVARQRLILLWDLMRYVVHLSWITWALPKLRHSVTPLLLWLNVLFWPGLLALLLLCAALETPLMAIFSLPLFTLAAPRRSKGLPWAIFGDGGASGPLVKGAEGLFYSIAVPSLLQSLALQWRAETLSKAPGTLLFCRSHERLACVVRVLASGFGWLQLELRGLELQEPTSCHHVEAGKIDEAFAHAFEGERAPERQSFVLQPICEVTCSTYEQSVISLRGLLDNPQLLKEIHNLFLKSLVWVLMAEDIPEGWLNCPLKLQDAKQVFQQICEVSWPKEVVEALHVPAHEREPLRAAAAASDLPQPPPGTPPIIRPPHKAWSEAVPLPTTAPATVEGDRWSSPGQGSRSTGDDDAVEDLDSLMDQVLGMAPGRMSRKKSDRVGTGAAAKQAARRLLTTEGESNRESDTWAAPTVAFTTSGGAPQPGANVHAASAAALEERERRRLSNESLKPPVAEELDLTKLSPLARLVIQAYVAVNVAPLFGQKPEAHGTSHVLRLFSGHIATAAGKETAELKWLVERPELFQLTCRAFRFAVKISIDAAAMGEELDMEYQNFTDLAEDLQSRWFLGVEGSMQWEVAMKRRWPNLMALKPGKGVSEVQVLRLRYSEDVCRVGELRHGVWSSIWASAAVELRYLANDDDERYSIQAHPTLFRNMAVQCAEYPIFVSYETVWL